MNGLFRTILKVASGKKCGKVIAKLKGIVRIVSEVVSMLPADGKDYSDYIKHLSNLIGILSLFSGFMFTTYAILITRLPDPSGIIAQFTLYILSLFLDIFLFLISQLNVMVIYSCRNVPPLSKRTAMVNSLFLLSVYVAMSFVTSLMPLLWNLVYLALVQTVQWILFGVAANRFIFKPFSQYRESISSE